MNTTVTIEKSLKAKLDEIGKKSESYNDIITRLYEDHKKRQKELVQRHAANLASEHIRKKDAASKYHAALLKDVAKGKTVSFSTFEEMLKD